MTKGRDFTFTSYTYICLSDHVNVMNLYVVDVIRNVAKIQILLLGPRLCRICQFRYVRKISFIISIWKPVL